MTDWIKDSINDAASQLWAGMYAKLWALITLSFLDPFYHWFVYGVGITIVCVVLAWFFGSAFPKVRAVMGAIIVEIALMLYVYWRSAKETRAYDAEKAAKKKRRK